MSTLYKGLTVPEYADAADAPAAFENFVDSGPIPRFADGTARDAAITTPTEGQFCYLLSTGKLQRYDGSSWLAYQTTPSGVLAMFVDTSPPTGWLLCDGAEVSRTTYSDLFAIIGTTYGTGNGSTTFNLPDFRQRSPLGKAISGTGATMGEEGGALTHIHTMPNHQHSVNIGSFSTTSDGSHTHGGLTGGETTGDGDGPSPGIAGSGHYHTIGSSGTAHTHGVDPPNANTSIVDPGDTAGQSSMSPYLVVTFIIKT